MSFDTLGEALAWYASVGYRTWYREHPGVLTLVDGFGAEMLLFCWVTGSVSAVPVPVTWRRGKQILPVGRDRMAVGGVL